MPYLQRPADVGALVGLTPRRVLELYRAGRIPGGVRVGARVRFDPEVVLAWIKAGGGAANDLPPLLKSGAMGAAVMVPTAPTRAESQR